MNNINDMDKEYANKSIECSIDSCANHCCNDKYCALQKIKVGTHGVNSTTNYGTDCVSFEPRTESMI